MGGNNISKDQQFHEDFLQNFNEYYKFYDDYIDFRLGHIKIYQGNEQNIGSTYVAVRNHMTNSDSDVELFDKVYGILSKDAPEVNPYIIKLISYNFQNGDENICGNTNMVQTYHEYYINNLEAEVLTRHERQLYFSEPELWAIIYSIASVTNFLQKHNHTLSDIRTRCILVTDQGQVFLKIFKQLRECNNHHLNKKMKFVPFGFFKNDIPGDVLTFSYGHYGLMAPEILEAHNNSQNRNFDQYRADMFSAGMTLLECGTLTSASLNYNYENFTINKSVTDDLQAHLRTKYSPFFCNLVQALLSYDPNMRPSPEQLYCILKPYEQEILNRQPFTPDFNQMSDALQQNEMLKYRYSFVQPPTQQQKQLQQQQSYSSFIQSQPLKDKQYIQNQFAYQSVNYEQPQIAAQTQATQVQSQIIQTAPQTQVVQPQVMQYVQVEQPVQQYYSTKASATQQVQYVQPSPQKLVTQSSPKRISPQAQTIKYIEQPQQKSYQIVTQNSPQAKTIQYYEQQQQIPQQQQQPQIQNNYIMKPQTIESQQGKSFSEIPPGYRVKEVQTGQPAYSPQQAMYNQKTMQPYDSAVQNLNQIDKQISQALERSKGTQQFVINNPSGYQ